jgi:hypothetical protein
LAVVVGRESLQGTDRHGLKLLPQQTSLFAIQLVLANPAANTREGVFFADFLEGCGKFTFRHQADEALYIDAQWARFDADGIFALQAAESLNLHMLERESQGYFPATLEPGFWRLQR